MQDFYLRTETEEAMDLILAPLDHRPDIAIDVLGVIYKTPEPLGEVSDPDVQMPEPEALPGWHANVRFVGEPTEEEYALMSPAMIPAPATPRRVWL